MTMGDDFDGMGGFEPGAGAGFGPDVDGFGGSAMEGTVGAPEAASGAGSVGDAVERAFEVMAETSAVDAEALRHRWGGDAAANLEYGRAFAEAHPELLDVVVRAGIADEPAVIEMAALLGRRYGGAPGQQGFGGQQGLGGQPNSAGGAPAASASTGRQAATLDAQIDAKHDELYAIPQWNTRARQKLYEQLQGLYRRRYGDGPLVGQGGRTL